MEQLAARLRAGSRRRAEGLAAKPARLCAGTDEQPLLAPGGSPAAPALLLALSSAERAVVAAALRGYRDDEIARQRGSSPHTVANLLSRAFRKLGVHSRAELAAKLVIRNGAALTPPHADCIADGWSVAVANDNQMSDGCARLATLSDRERQVARRVALGHSYKQIAYDLGLGMSTVWKYLQRAAIKLGANSRVGLIQLMNSLPEADEASSGDEAPIIDVGRRRRRDH
jgi:DNA-binding CsgD family transcriptional regulator